MLVDLLVVDPVPAPTVALVRWPDDATVREELARDGRPRLLLVGEGVAPPPPADELEDWIRIPADELDLWSRMQRLDRIHRRTQLPWLDEQVLHSDGTTTVLPSSGAELLTPLLERFRHVVDRAVLEQIAFPSGPPSSRSLDTRMHRLRSSLQGTGLTLHTVRGRGFVLDHDPWPQADRHHSEQETQWPAS